MMEPKLCQKQIAAAQAEIVDPTPMELYQTNQRLQAALDAERARAVYVCQRCGRVAKDGWVETQYESMLDGPVCGLKCPSCDCPDLEKNTAKELAAICTKAQTALKPCLWTYDDIHDYYETACGGSYCLTTGTLDENKHRYCVYCGGQIEVAAQGGGGDEG